MATRLNPILTRVFVAADEAGLTVLNLTDRPLSKSERRVLLNLATSHRDVLLSPDNTYRDLVEHIDRVALRELRLTASGGSYWQRGLLIGLAGGALIMYGVASRCGPGAAPAECSGYALIIFAPIGAALGAGAGATIGASILRPSSGRVLYTAP